MAGSWQQYGKIGYVTPSISAFDTYRIQFSKDGTQANLQDVSAVYYVDDTRKAVISALDPVTQIDDIHAYLEQNCLVWQRWYGEEPTEKALTIDQSWSENKTRLFTCPANADINSIRTITLTGATQAYGTKYVAIIDAETGLTVGYSTSETVDQSTVEKYGITGKYVIWTFNSTVHLEQGKQYYICDYVGSTDGGKKPLAYYDGETTTVKDVPASLVNTTQADLRNTTFGGTLTGTSAVSQYINIIMAGASDNLYLYTGNSKGNITNTSAINSNHVYRKNSTYSGHTWSGVVPADQSKESGLGPTLGALAVMTSGDMAVTDKTSWDPNDDGGNTFMRTDAEVVVADAGTLTITTATIRSIIMNDLAFTQAATSHVFINAQYFNAYGNKYTGEMNANTMWKTDNTKYNASLLGVDTYINAPPDNPQDGYLYWKAGRWGGIPNWESDCIAQYKNGSWNNNITAWFEEQYAGSYDGTHTLINDAYTDLGVSNQNVLTATESTGKKYYFELVKTDNTIIEV